MIDTHAHLYSEQFDSDRELMIKRAISAGVSKFFLPNIDLDSIDGMHQLELDFPNHCYAMMGLHPCSVDSDFTHVLNKMKNLVDARFASKKPYAAIGEIGIDLYWDKTFLIQQKEAFRVQLQWAKELNLPVVIHARESFDAIFEILDLENDSRLRGVFHCFTGNEAHAKTIIDYGGFMFGIGGVITYKKADLETIRNIIPLEKLVLETDAPYLAPTPHRGKRNESAFLIHSAQKLAECKHITLKELEQITDNNAMRLFGSN
jgi:TatD DNase family protein